MSEKTVIITGSSSGFGMLTAIQCAKKGFRVIATMRNLDKKEVFEAQELDPDVRNRIEFKQLDVTNEASLKTFTDWLEELDRVDVVVNNAGFAIGGFLEQVPLADFRRQFDTNVLGVVAVTQAVLPKMRKQKAGKILNVSSVSGRIGFPALSAYVASKHALEGLTESLRLEMKPFGIDVGLIEPGSFRTNIWSSGMEIPNEVNNPDSPYAPYIKGIWDELNNQKKYHGNPNDVAQMVTKLAMADTLKKLRYPIGSGARLNMLMKQIIPWSLLEKTVLRKLYPAMPEDQEKRLRPVESGD
ncbi:SDR family oxidoreductase [Thalassobacillus sp. CUG 92003]|uniref:SDR family oxidoreductase n=1 Tax=Thalassobacillus sp. CUG 92003 TaxID=2736641 RepID=UPI0015E72A50|nr:SDR family oxidoreductase [Thalassobacillus sp. CUG 92003]